MDSIKCKMCEETFDQTDATLVEEFESIEECGRCTACVEEYGTGGLWPDQF